MAKRAELLDFAILGLLHESPMHGYELRKRLSIALGASGIFRALSYGSLYPALRALLDRGDIVEAAAPQGGSGSKRARIVYELTAAGKERFQDLAGQAGPSAWDDEGFGVHLAFFARTTEDVRLRILEGRRSRLEERLAQVREASARGRERMDAYSAALQRHGEEQAEREVRWLDELIRTERETQAESRRTPAPPAPRTTRSTTRTASTSITTRTANNSTSPATTDHHTTDHHTTDHHKGEAV